jgi:integrase
MRVKDFDFDRDTIVVRSGKGNKDRVTLLPRGAADDHDLHPHSRCTRWDVIAISGPHRFGFREVPLLY